MERKKLTGDRMELNVTAPAVLSGLSEGLHRGARGAETPATPEKPKVLPVQDQITIW